MRRVGREGQDGRRRGAHDAGTDLRRPGNEAPSRGGAQGVPQRRRDEEGGRPEVAADARGFQEVDRGDGSEVSRLRPGSLPGRKRRSRISSPPSGGGSPPAGPFYYPGRAPA